VPLLLTTDATAVTLTGEDDVVGAVGQQIERLRADDSESARMGLAYLVTHGVSGRRISALIVGTP
jgi:hypothetical protein